jgi:hypothetical protein
MPDLTTLQTHNLPHIVPIGIFTCICPCDRHLFATNAILVRERFWIRMVMPDLNVVHDAKEKKILKTPTHRQCLCEIAFTVSLASFCASPNRSYGWPAFAGDHQLLGAFLDAKRLPVAFCHHLPDWGLSCVDHIGAGSCAFVITSCRHASRWLPSMTAYLCKPWSSTEWCLAARCSTRCIGQSRT